MRSILRNVSNVCLLNIIDDNPTFDDSDAVFNDALIIFTNFLGNKVIRLCKEEDISSKDCKKMIFKAGEDLRNLIKVYTGIDTYNPNGEHNKDI